MDADLQNVTGTVLVALLLLKAAYMVVTHNSEHIPFQLRFLQYQQSLTVDAVLTLIPRSTDIDSNHIAQNCGHYFDFN